MSLTISSRIIAEENIQTIALRSVVGAYQLMIPLRLEVHPEERSRRQATITGARITVKPSGGREQTLGFARPEVPITVRPLSHPQSVSGDLMLTLQPQQVAAIEDLRAGRDLEFELSIAGTAFDGVRDQPVYDRWRVHIPLSTWITNLKGAGALDIRLLEVPTPVRELSGEWAEVGEHLQQAQKHFVDADYHACIALCRLVAEESGHKLYGKKGWADPLLGRLANSRAKMTKSEREGALLATIRHYAHPAHHAGSEGGVSTYTRSEAKLVLELTTALVAHVHKR